MTIEAARLAVVVDADTSAAEAGLGRLGGRFGGFGSMLAGGAVAGGTAVAALGGLSVSSAMKIEDAFAPVGTLLGVNSSQFGELDSKMRTFLANGPSSADEIGASAYSALSAGITDTQGVMDALAASQQLALAGLGDMPGSMDLITSAMNSFVGEGLTADEAARTFFGTVASGKTTTADLAQGFGQIAPLAASAGVGFGDLMAATAALTSTGMSASTAYSGIRGALTAIVAPTAEAAEAAKGLGLDFSQAHLAAVGLPAFLDEVRTATGGNVETMATLFGGVEGLNAVLALTGPQADAFASNLDGISAAGDNLAVRAAEMESTTSNTWAEFKNKATVALGGVGAKLIDYLLPKLETAVAWVEDNWPEISKTISAVFDKLRKAWEDYGRPVFDALVTAGAAVVGWIQDHWPQISETISTVMTTIQEVISGVIEFVQLIWRNFGDEIMANVESAFTFIKNIIESAMRVIQGIVDTVMGVLTGDWSRAWDGIKNIFGGVWDAIKAMFQRAVDIVKIIFGALLDAMKAAGQAIWDWVKALPGKIVDAIGDVASTLWDKGVNLVEGMLGGIAEKALAVFEWFKALPGKIIDTIGDVATTLKNKGLSIVTGFWGGVIEKYVAVRDWFVELPGKIVAAIGDLSKKLWNKGKELIQGFIDGIKDAAKSIAGAIGDAISGGIPGLGGFPGIGTISGLISSAGPTRRGLAELTSNVVDLDEVRTSRDAAGITDTGRSGPTVINHFTIQTYGTDRQWLVDVGRELEHIARGA